MNFLTLFKSKLLLKKAFLWILSKFGVLAFLHYKNRHKICVLMLHGVMEKQTANTWNPLRSQISPNELKRTLKILSGYYRFINIDQAVDILTGQMPLIDNAMLITFDDGYRNNIDYALPICEQFGIKPVLFVVTGHIDSGLPFWFDRFDYALQQNMGEWLSLQYEHETYLFDATSRGALQKSYKVFRDDCKRKFTDDIKMNQLFNGLSEMLEQQSGKALSDICADDDWSAIASWSQLQKAVTQGRMDVASHTVDHFRLGNLSAPQMLSQIKQSKIRIEEKMAVKCQYFCYPNGNYNKSAISLLKSNGFKAAFSTDVGLCQSKDDLMTLKRFSFPLDKSESELLYLLNR
ncbi:polysaccharide deacetylase family protein [Psychromonas hadalis]|uniref:polysaccharide deacetylase family protein n=1 Tax=Psychromonas hadalis TaxID=211669 RepID=UPI00068790FB|nr:polysaccharide deacetylase family protein [Psychromonas hadalis]